MPPCWEGPWAPGCSTRSASSAAWPTRSTPSTTRWPTRRSSSSQRAWTPPSAPKRSSAWARSWTSCGATAPGPRRWSGPAPTQPDARLAALAGDGHERAFEAIVDRYRRPLHRYCRRVVPESRAEDAVQQTFLNAWSTLAAGTEVEDLRAWLYRIARNAALDAARTARPHHDELTP